MQEAKGYELPVRDEQGFCNVLLSALGGDGANMAAKLLFKIGCTEFGLNGGYDAKYGSEKKGTATDVSVRFCGVDTAVRQSGPTQRPNFLVVFHDDLIVPLDLGRGLQADATCIVNSIQPPTAIRELLHLHSGTVICVDATKIAVQAGSRLNMPLVAVLAHELRFPGETIKTVITRQWPKAAERNIAAFSEAMSRMTRETFAPDDRFPLTAPMTAQGPIGWRNMLNGGTIDAVKFITTNRDNRIAGRGLVPKFDLGACTHCGICLTVCSDPGGILWRQGRMEGIDPLFCKGCMRCVEVCPDTKKGRALTVE